MLGILFDILMLPIERLFYRAVSKDRRDDPTYKKNVAKLIESSRETREKKD